MSSSFLRDKDYNRSKSGVCSSKRIDLALEIWSGIVCFLSALPPSCRLVFTIILRLNNNSSTFAFKFGCKERESNF